MRFISVFAAVATAIGTTFDFGLPLGAEPATWVKIPSPESGFSASFHGQPQYEWARFSQPATAPHSAVAVAVD